VLLQVGGRRVALPAGLVAELAPPVRLHAFPHTSKLIAGVIVRRGRIVPVYEAGLVLGGRRSSSQRFYLIARWQIGDAGELAGTLAVGEDSFDVLNLDSFAALYASTTGGSVSAESPS
jgi:chemotaxis signal transduction protein